MIPSPRRSRLITGITIFMLVWCQTAAAAFTGFAAIAVSAAESVVTAPCHQIAAETRGDSGKQRNGPRCQSRDASVENAKVHLPAMAAQPHAARVNTLPAPLAVRAAPDDQSAVRATPPPLILVYCRLQI